MVINYKRVHCIGDQGHDPAGDDEQTNSGLFELIKNKYIDSITFISSGRFPNKSNNIVKNQSVIFSKLHMKNYPMIFYADKVIETNEEWNPSIGFYETSQGGGIGLVSNPPTHLYNIGKEVEAIKKKSEEKLIEETNNGIILLANAPGYAIYLQNMVDKGADFSKSILIIQGATNEKDVFTTYNEKYGWASIEQRAKYLDKFSKVYIHGRELAYKDFQLNPTQLCQIGSILTNHGYHTSPDKYQQDALCGEQSINFIKTGAFTASRIMNNSKMWEEEGPYGLMRRDLNSIIDTLPLEQDSFNEYIKDTIATSKDPTISTESKHPSTQVGIEDLYEFKNNKDSKEIITPTPLGYRVLLMLYLINGNSIKLNEDKNIINFLKQHTNRVIYDPIGLFVIHSILDTEQSKKYNITLRETTVGNIVEEIIPESSLSTPFDTLLTLMKIESSKDIILNTINLT